MTDRSVSWTDAERVTQLLSRASAPRRIPAAPALGFSGRAQGGDARPLPNPMRGFAPPARSKPKSQAPGFVPRLEQTSDHPSDRLDALLAWTLDHHRCTGAFVADDNGLTLATHGVSEAHVALVGPLLSALAGVRSIPGVDATAGALWLGTNMMSWVETRTARGGFCLGALALEPLSTRGLEQLKEALELTVRGL